MRIQALAALALALSCSGPAAAQQPRQRAPVAPECSDDRGTDRCAAEQHQRVLGLFGVPPIERLRDDGAQVRRVFYVDGSGRDVAVISFIRSPGRDPFVTVQAAPSVAGAEFQSRPQPLEAQVPEAIWYEILQASELFDRELAPREAELCMHASVYTVEASDPRNHYEPPRLRRKTGDACRARLVSQFARVVGVRALALLPHCALLDRRDYLEAAEILALCTQLSGDRSAAAGALNAAEPLRFVDRAEEFQSVDDAFGTTAQLVWAGQGHGGAPEAAARLWLSKILERTPTRFWPQRMHGETGSRVLITGILRRPGPGDADQAYEEAEVEQIWVRQPHGRWEIERATVQPFNSRVAGAPRR